MTGSNTPAPSMTMGFFVVVGLRVRCTRLAGANGLTSTGTPTRNVCFMNPLEIDEEADIGGGKPVGVIGADRGGVGDRGNVWGIGTEADIGRDGCIVYGTKKDL